MGRIVGWVRPETKPDKENAEVEKTVETQETAEKAPGKKSARKEQE